MKTPSSTPKASSKRVFKVDQQVVKDRKFVNDIILATTEVAAAQLLQRLRRELLRTAR